MKRLLAVSWEMPPMYGPRGFQVSRLLSHLPPLGWRTSVVCLDPRRGGPHWRDGSGDAPPAGIDLVRVASPEESLPYRVGARLFGSLREHPDRSAPWIAPAAQAALEVARGGVAGVATFAQPWSDHLVGLRVHRETRLPWVAHFSDPWVDSPYATPRQRAAWKPMEADVVREATALVFVTGETADLVMGKYPAALRAKAAIVPHGFEPRPVSRPSRAPGGPMNVVYTGRFYAGLRTPTSLLRALAGFDRERPLDALLHVTFVGPHVEEFRDEAATLRIDRLVTFRGRVPRDEAAAIAAAADVLLVIDAPADGASVFLPSKLIDYLAYRRPIVGLTPRTGASASLLARLGCPIAPPDDAAAIRALIEELVGRWEAGTLDVPPSFDAVAAEYEMSNTARLFDGVLTRAFA